MRRRGETDTSSPSSGQQPEDQEWRPLALLHGDTSVSAAGKVNIHQCLFSMDDGILMAGDASGRS